MMADGGGGGHAAVIQQVIGSIGVLLVMAGVIVIAMRGDFSRIYLEPPRENEDKLKKRARIFRWNKVGTGCVIVGSVLQIAAYWL